MRVATIRISTIAHATEDVEKVLDALELLASQEFFRSKVMKTRLKGHYGNEITTITLKLKERFAIVFFHRLWTRLPRDNIASLIQNVESHLDENGRFHLRLDKQLAALGTLQLTERDPIKIEVTFSGAPELGSKPRETIRKMIEFEGPSPHAE